MTRSITLLSGAFVLGVLALGSQAQAAPANQVLPMPEGDIIKMDPRPQVATFAGGCFWGVQAVFQHVDGVTSAVSGYAGGKQEDADYEKVSAGVTDHTETVQVTFDPKKISYGKLLQIFFSVALNPTEKDRQGADLGRHYRSILFVADPEQAKIAQAYIAQLEAAHVFDKPILTQIDTTSQFYTAEVANQDYLQLHLDEKYIIVNDLPLVRSLQAVFPQVWRATPIKTQVATN